MAPIDIRPRGGLPSFVIPPGEKGIERRRRLAEVLAQQGTDTSPVQSWTQGAARVAQSLASVLGNYQANQMEQQRNSALAEALRTGTADQLMMSMDADLQRVGMYKAQQAQEAAAAKRQAENDAYNRTRDVTTDEHWAQNFAQQAAQQAETNARADAAAAKPRYHQVLNADGSSSLMQEDPSTGQLIPAKIQGQENAPGTPANPDHALPIPVKGMSESEQKNMRFYKRARAANATWTPQDSEAMSSVAQTTINATGNLPVVGPYVGQFTNAFQSDQYRQAKQKSDVFLNALGFSDSGASSAREEYWRQFRAYFPQVNDDPKTLEQKARSRAQALSALKQTTGKGSPILDQEERVFQDARNAINVEKKDPSLVMERLKDLGYSPEDFY